MGKVIFDRETLMSETKLNESMTTKLEKVARRSTNERRATYGWLMPLISKEALIACFHELKGNKAVGLDGITKEEYGRDLERNVENLIIRMKQLSYRPSPVREVLIPKDTGGYRPLGISNLEDKIIQLVFSNILTAIYEPIFRDCSYGFRKGRGCHTAIKALRDHLYRGRVKVVIDVDLKNFFGTLDHDKLTALLRLKIKDEVFMRYIHRMLKAGVLADGELTVSEEGTPQGSIVSPILANIYAHYAMDEWIETTIRAHCTKSVRIFRYGDDQVICCSDRTDAHKVMKTLPKRLERFGLSLNPKKTKVVNFDRDRALLGQKQGSFDFLGFTFLIGRSSQGFLIPKVKTSTKRYNGKLKRAWQWCRRYRNRYRMRELWKLYCRKLVGHIRYFGISFNGRLVGRFIRRATRAFFHWMNRRSQKRSQSWEKFNLFLKRYPPPPVRIYHTFF